MILSILLIISLVAGQLIKLPVGFGGITLLDLTISALVIFYLWKIKLKLKKPNFAIKSILFFIFLCLASLTFTPLKLTLPEYLLSLSYTLRLIVYFLFGWIIYSARILKQKEILRILIFAGLSLGLIGLVQFLILPDLRFLASSGWDPHYFRIVSTFLDPNFVGAFFVLTLLLIYQYGLKFFSQNLRKFFFAFEFVCLLLTFSRGAYLMFIVSFFLLALLNKSSRLLSIVILLTFILGVSFNYYLEFIASPRNIDRQQSAEYRVNAWSQGLAIFSKNPILGVGFNSYRYAISEYKLASVEFIESRGASTNDSSLLYVAATTGILGLISYLALIVSLMIYSLKLFFLKNQNGIILLAVLTGLLAHSLFANSLFYPFILIWLILYLNLTTQD